MNKGTVPDGERMLVVGRVISIKSPISKFSGGEYKRMLLEVIDEDDCPSKVSGTVPAKLPGKVERGTIVSMNATISRSKDDPAFGFFSRPTSAVIIGKAR